MARAIAPIVGVDQKTVVRDIAREAPVQNWTPVAELATEPANYLSPNAGIVGLDHLPGAAKMVSRVQAAFQMRPRLTGLQIGSQI